MIQVAIVSLINVIIVYLACGTDSFRIPMFALIYANLGLGLASGLML